MFDLNKFPARQQDVSTRFRVPFFWEGESGGLKMSRNEAKVYLIIVLLICGLALAAWFGEQLNNKLQVEASRTATENKLGNLRSRLEGNLRGDIQLVKGLVSLIATHPHLSQDEFSRAAKPLFEAGSHLRNIGAAPDMVIRMMYPLAGNEKAIGLDYRKRPSQIAMAERARDTGQMVLAGPIQLVQGGYGIISEFPVFEEDVQGQKKFWGLTSAVIDVDRLYRSSGLLDADLPFEIAIRGIDGKGSQGEVFFGRPELFDAHPVLADVVLPNGSWVIAAIPRGGWITQADNVWGLRLTFLLISFLILSPFFALAKALGSLENARRQIEAKKDHLQLIIETEPECIKIVDSRGKLLEMNAAGLTMLEANSLEEAQQKNLLSYIDPDYQDAFTSLHHRVMKGESGTLEFRIKGLRGTPRYLETRATPMRDADGKINSLLGVTRDITKARLADRALVESEAKYRQLFEAASDGTFLLDASGTFFDCNENGAKLFGFPRARIIGYTPAEVSPERQPEGYLSAEIMANKFEAALAGETQRFEYRALRADGNLFDAEITLNRIEYRDVYFLLAVVRDITQRKEAEQALKNSKNQLTAILNSTTESIFQVDENGIILTINDNAARRVKKESKDMIGRCAFDFFPPEVSTSRRESLAEVFRTGAGIHTEDKRNDHFFSLSYYPIIDNNGKVASVVVYAADITERKKVEAEVRIAAISFESQEGMIVTDANCLILRVNRAFTAITGYTADDVIGKNPRLLSSGRQDASFYKAMWARINQTGGWEGEIWNRRKNGDAYPEHLTITAVKDPNGRIINYVATLIDITLSKKSEEEIKNLAFFDPLTRLPNRRLLQDRLQQALVSSGRNGKEGAILFIDLDNFKNLNDTRGHDIGDLLLEQVAERLTACVRTGDTVARLGGDEFVVMLEELSENILEAAEQTELVGNKILTNLNQTYHIGGHTHHSTPSIGATLFNKQKSIDELLKQADIAMYQAKNAGRNTLRFFDPRMQQSISARMALEIELRKALESRQFHLYYQIQVDDMFRPLGAEALIRWIHPERGLISPIEFIPMAEEIGLIFSIGWWVIETACAQLQAWQKEARTSSLVLSVNVSAKQFHQADFADQILAAVQYYDIDPKLLKIELTESMLLDNIETTIATMYALKECGVRFSLDDFGTGYSSLQYLKRLPLDQLKIDQSFVRDIAADNNDKAIVSTIIAMAKGMNLDVIAEGVETEEQRQLLLSLECAHFQGYLFGKPLPIEQFEALIAIAEVS